MKSFNEQNNPKENNAIKNLKGFLDYSINVDKGVLNI